MTSGKHVHRSSYSGAVSDGLTLFLVALILYSSAACRQEMHDQPHHEALEASSFFADGQASRQPVEGTIARGHLRTDEHLYAGRVQGEPAQSFPFPISKSILDRGQQRFGIYCTPCHGTTGDGQGIVVQRGFTKPPSYHTPAMREKPVGHYYDVITNGFGAMYDFRDRITPEDRWAIVAYVRALQLSRNATIEDVPEDKRTPLLK